MLKTKRSKLELIIPPVLALIWNQIVYNGAQLIAKSWKHYDMTTEFDSIVPFLPWTVLIYFGCYILWGINYYLCSKADSTMRDRYFCADFLSKAICLILFLGIPTTNIRPDIATDQNIFNILMRFLYWIDSADNLFPSIHCLVSWLCWIGVRNRKDIHIAYRYFTLFAAVAVCLSTLTTRQHVIVDVFSGIIIAELCYFISGYPKIRNIYSKMLSFVFKIFIRPVKE